MSNQPEKLDLRSQDIAEDRRQELLRLFPEIRTEGGKIDFERLKLALGEAVDVGRERYGMNWPGSLAEEEGFRGGCKGSGVFTLASLGTVTIQTPDPFRTPSGWTRAKWMRPKKRPDN